MAPESDVHQSEPGGARRRGQFVFAALALLTALEFAVSVWFGGVLFALALIALTKAGLIVVYFMHVGDLGTVLRQEVSR